MNTPAASRFRNAFDRCTPTPKFVPVDRREAAEEAVNLGRRRNAVSGLALGGAAGARQLG